MIADFKKNKKRNPINFFLLILGGILILSISVLLIISDIKIYKKKEKLNSQIESLKNKIEDIQNKNKDLKEGILKANDEKYIEKVAREELDLQKEGEKVVSFVVPENQGQENNLKPKNILQVWLSWLGGSWEWIKNRF